MQPVLSLIEYHRLGAFHHLVADFFAALGRQAMQENRSGAGLLPGQIPITNEQLFFNFADLTPNIAATDREYLYGSFDRDLCDKYLTVFADFKYFRQFWDGAAAPTPFEPDVWTDQNNPFGISSVGISVPTQNAFNPFTVADYTSTGGSNPSFPQTQASARWKNATATKRRPGRRSRGVRSLYMAFGGQLTE